MTEVFINNQRVEMDDFTMSQTFQLSDIADLSTKQTSYTNRLKAPKTPANIALFDYISMYKKYELTGGLPLDFPYGTPPTAKIVEDGIEITRDGYVVLFDVPGKYFAFAVYGTERAFFDTAKDTTLQDCYDPSDREYLDAYWFQNYLDDSNHVIFAVCRHNNFDFVARNNKILLPEYSSPQFFVNNLFERVFIYLGYTVNYPIVNGTSLELLDSWNNWVVSAGAPMSSTGNVYGDYFAWQELAPKMTVDVFLKEVMIRYGLMVRVDELNKTVTFKSLDELILNGEVEDWSDKFDSVTKDKYKINKYGQTNLLKYSDDELGELTGEYSLINRNLKKESSIFTSKYKKPIYGEEPGDGLSMDMVGGDLRQYSIIDLTEAELNTVEPTPGVLDGYELDSATEELDYHFFNVKRIDVINYQHNIKNNNVPIDYRIVVNPYVYILQYEDRYRTYPGGSGTPVDTSLQTTHMQPFINDYWKYTIQLLDRMHLVTAKVNLNTVDIYQLDFFKLKYIKQLGGLFYLNKVRGYKKGKTTRVELMKIPGLTV